MNGKKALLFLVLMLLISLPVNLLEIKADLNNSMILPGEVTLYSPLNTTYSSNFLGLNLSFAWGAGMQCKLNYNIDEQFTGPIPLTYNDSDASGFQLFAFETGYVQLPELSNGCHKLTINIEADLNDYHGANPPGAPFKQTAPGSANYVATWIDTVDFTIDAGIGDLNSTPPKLTNISIENQTYKTTNIPLSFTVDEKISQAAYSLDGQANVTIAGNTTLTGLTVGAHNVTVYAWNEAGKGCSQTINFSVAEGLSAVVQPSHPFLMDTIIAVLLAFSVGVVLTFLLFFRKGKR